MGRIKIYLDCNIYNYLVDGKSISQDDIEKLINAVDNHTVEVLFSPVNLVEIVRCYESKESKAKKMIEISYKLSKHVTKTPNEILVDQLNAFINSQGFQYLNPYYSQESLFDKIRKGILNIDNYSVPQEFHGDVKKYASWYVNSLTEMKSSINKMLSEEMGFIKPSLENTNTISHLNDPVDLYKVFNLDDAGRKMFVEAIFKDRCGFAGQIPYINNFDAIPSFSIFLKFYFKAAYELIMYDKEPRSSDWGDLDQTTYFYYVDYVVTSDTGKAGIYPNYRGILDEILQPMKKSAIEFSSLISQLERI
jgi:hypothetical protein